MPATSTVSARKLQANRSNAQKSTGPRTAEGKARSSGNAAVHGFYSSALLLPGENPEELDELRHGLMRDLRPQGTAEALLVEQLVSHHWKLRRLQQAERRMLENHQQLLAKHQGKQQASEPGAVQAEMIYSAGEEIERLSLLQRRLENSVHRCLRELRLLRKDRQQWQEETEETPAEDVRPAEAEAEPSPQPSPGVPGKGAMMPTIENVRNEPTAGAEEEVEAARRDTSRQR